MDVLNTIDCGLHNGAPAEFFEVPYVRIGHAVGLDGRVVGLGRNAQHLYCTSVVCKVAELAGNLDLGGPRALGSEVSGGGD